MFDKKLSLLVLLIPVLGGCIKSPFKKSNKKERSSRSKKRGEFIKEGGTYVFSDDADEFRLDDDGNVFEGDGDYVGDNDEFQWDNIVYDTDAGEVIQFDFDDTSIKPSEKAKIEHNAELAKQEIDCNPNSQVAVKGHSCKIAKSKLYNRAISQERAENVAKEYSKHGVPRDKVSAVGYGASELLTDEDGREAQSVNRRVETDFVANPKKS